MNLYTCLTCVAVVSFLLLPGSYRPLLALPWKGTDFYIGYQPDKNILPVHRDPASFLKWNRQHGMFALSESAMFPHRITVMTVQRTTYENMVHRRVVITSALKAGDQGLSARR